MVVDQKTDLPSSSIHSIRVLPPHTTTLDIGILDPEAVILERHLFTNPDNLIQASPHAPLIKTPAGSHITITHCSGDIVTYQSHGRGVLSWLLRKLGIAPQQKWAGRFSQGVFARPMEHQQEYDTIKKQLPRSSP